MRLLPVLSLVACVDIGLPGMDVPPDVGTGVETCIQLSASRADLTPQTPSAAIDVLDNCGAVDVVDVVLDDPDGAFRVDDDRLELSEVGAAAVVVHLQAQEAGTWEAQLLIRLESGERAGSVQLAGTVP